MRIAAPRCALTSQDDDIESLQDLLMAAKTLPNQPLDSISGYRQADMFLGNRQAEPGSVERVAAGQNREAGIARPLRSSKHRLEICGAKKSEFSPEARVTRLGHARWARLTAESDVPGHGRDEP